LSIAAEALASFVGVKRRMELLAEIDGVRVYDDFAHHPTAIATTLQGLRAGMGEGRILLLLEPRSRSMRMGQHRDSLPTATAAADQVWWYQPAGLDWDLQDVVAASPVPAELCSDTLDMVKRVIAVSRAGDHIVIMSNGGFEGIHQTLVGELTALQQSKA
jgi:UDP-N-acetylmuramate: L-alanyl-gamma-D-glutamyl-meso-diaminopimelate ligase